MISSPDVDELYKKLKTDKRRGQATLESAFKSILNKIVENPDVDVTSLFPTANHT